MDERLSYLDKLNEDLLGQFADQPNILTFNRALARQLEELHDFFGQLLLLRTLQTAQGVQLDGIGDIVGMSRRDALALSKQAGQYVPMDDPTYRLYLIWKINQNTSNCTYQDVMSALKMFWDSPLYYSEDPDYPATMFITTGTLTPEQNANVLLIAPKVKAAGVALVVTAITETPIPQNALGVGVALNGSMTVTTLPPL